MVKWQTIQGNLPDKSHLEILGISVAILLEQIMVKRFKLKIQKIQK